MRKGALFLTCILILTMIFTSGCTIENSEATETQVWRFGHEEVAGAVMDVYAQEFKRVVEERTDGRITVEVYRTGEIGSHVDHLEFVQGGLLDFAIVNPGSSSTTVPENNIFYNHFLLPGEEEDIRTILNESKAIGMLNEINEENEMKVLDWFYEGFNMWTTNKAIRSPADFKGQKIRTMQSPLIVASYQAYGANPTPMPYMEVYSGLQLGQIEAQVNPIFAIEEMSFYEVQDYLILSKQDAFIAAMTANLDFYENLSEEDKRMVDEVTLELNEYIFNEQRELNETRLEKIRQESDIEIIELTAEERELFREASQSAREVFKKSVGSKGIEILNLLEAEVTELRESKK